MGNQSSLDRAQDSLFDLKLTSKRFGKAHKKAQSKQKAALAKVKKRIFVTFIKMQTLTQTHTHKNTKHSQQT